MGGKAFRLSQAYCCPGGTDGSPAAGCDAEGRNRLEEHPDGKASRKAGAAGRRERVVQPRRIVAEDFRRIVADEQRAVVVYERGNPVPFGSVCHRKLKVFRGLPVCQCCGLVKVLRDEYPAEVFDGSRCGLPGRKRRKLPVYLLSDCPGKLLVRGCENRLGDDVVLRLGEHVGGNPSGICA